MEGRMTGSRMPRARAGCRRGCAGVSRRCLRGLIIFMLVLTVCVALSEATKTHSTTKHAAKKHKSKQKHTATPPAPAPTLRTAKSPAPLPSPRTPPSSAPRTAPQTAPSRAPRTAPTRAPRTAPSPAPSRSTDGVFDVRSFGAKGDGMSDDTQAFLAAWAKACTSSGTVTVLAARGYSFVIGSNTVFSGKGCSSKMTLQVDGNLLGPGAKSKWKNAGGASASWMQFQDCTDFVIQGTGTLDARGQAFWSSGGGGPIGIRFLRFTNVGVRGITLTNTPQVGLKFNVGQGALVQGITIINPGNSPNTDGIHLETNVHAVQILNCVIKTGDDCISIGTGTFNVVIQGIFCGPGHGISIGSLGTKGLVACVSDIDISQVTFVGTLTGCRVKTCAGGTGKAARITYRDINVQNVQYPIVIDQFYCSPGKPQNSPNVILDSISFYNVQGTTASHQPVTLKCASRGCTNIRLEDIQIANGQAAICSNAYGTSGGVMQPPSCLLGNSIASRSPSAAGCAL